MHRPMCDVCPPSPGVKLVCIMDCTVSCAVLYTLQSARCGQSDYKNAAKMGDVCPITRCDPHVHVHSTLCSEQCATVHTLQCVQYEYVLHTSV